MFSVISTIFLYSYLIIIKSFKILTGWVTVSWREAESFNSSFFVFSGILVSPSESSSRNTSILSKKKKVYQIVINKIK